MSQTRLTRIERHHVTELTDDAVARVVRCRAALAGERPDGAPGVAMSNPGVISFAHGNGLNAPPHEVVEAGIAALNDGSAFPLERYNFGERYEPLEAQIRMAMANEGLPLDHLAAVCVDAGTTRLFLAYLTATTAPGDVVLVAPTFYHGLAGWCRDLGLGLATVSTSPDSAHKLSASDLECAQLGLCRRYGRSSRSLVLFNPTQVGAIYTDAELADLASFCLRWGMGVLEDTIFARTRFDLDTPMPRLANQPDMGDRAVTVDGCSKADGLANLRVGWAVGPPRLIAALEAHKAAGTVGVPHVALVMADRALRVAAAHRRACSRCLRTGPTPSFGR